MGVPDRCDATHDGPAGPPPGTEQSRRGSLDAGATVLTVRGVSARYGRSVNALTDVSCEVPEDGVLAVLGGNGAGKSTLLRAASGTLGLHRGAVSAGEIVFDGTRIDRLDPALIVRSGVVAVPE